MSDNQTQAPPLVQPPVQQQQQQWQPAPQPPVQTWNPEDWRPASRFNELAADRDRLKSERESLVKEYEAFKANAIEKAKYEEVLAERDKILADLQNTRIASTLMASGIDVDEDITSFLVDRWKKAGDKAGEFQEWFEKAKTEDKLVARMLPDVGEEEQEEEQEEEEEKPKKQAKRPTPRAGKKPPAKETGIKGGDLAKMSMEEYKKHRALLLEKARTRGR